jgi:ABC-type oligopeptide transport system ATPase subunit
MLKEKMVASGDTATVFSAPYHPYTELLLSSVPRCAGLARRVLGARATGAAETSALLGRPDELARIP